MDTFEVEEIVSNTIRDYFSISNIKDNLNGIGIVSSKLIQSDDNLMSGGGFKDKLKSATSKIGSKIKNKMKHKEEKSLEKKGIGKGEQQAIGAFGSWATQPGPGKSNEGKSIVDYSENMLKVLVKIFSTILYVIMIPLMPWIWIFSKTKEKMDLTYKKSLRPL